MRCEEYREALLADPSESFAGGSAHTDQCAACRRYRNEIRQFDKRIAAALAIDVPPLRKPALPRVAAIDDRRTTPKATRPLNKARLPAWIGLAASLVVAAVLGVYMIAPDEVRPTIAEQVIAHMDHEQASRQVTSEAVPDQVLRRVLGPNASSIGPRVPLITYARSCVINERVVPHLVVQGEYGPVTLILMPDESIDEPIPLSGENVHGTIVPVGTGSIAIIGERPDQVDEINRMGQRLAESVQWRT